MITAPTNYEAIFTQADTEVSYYAVVRLVVDSSTYGTTSEFGTYDSALDITFTADSITGDGFLLEHNMFDNLSAGNIAAASLTFSIVGDDRASCLQRLQRVQVKVDASNTRLNKSFSNLLLGTFYIDSINETSDGVYKVVALDALGFLDNIVWIPGDNGKIYCKAYYQLFKTHYLGLSEKTPDVVFCCEILKALNNLLDYNGRYAPAAYYTNNSFKDTLSQLMADQIYNMYINRSTGVQTGNWPLNATEYVNSVPNADRLRKATAASLRVDEYAPFSSFVTIINGNAYTSGLYGSGYFLPVDEDADVYNANNTTTPGYNGNFDNVESTGIQVTPLLTLGDTVYVQVGSKYFKFTVHNLRLRFINKPTGPFGDLGATRQPNTEILIVGEPDGTETITLSTDSGASHPVTMKKVSSNEISITGVYVVTTTRSVWYQKSVSASMDISYTSTATGLTVNTSIDTYITPQPYVNSSHNISEMFLYTSALPDDMPESFTLRSSYSLVATYSN